ncbi:MAG: type II toxin-antitoxin system VapC family toxin [Acidimicrobiales bacterium]
MIYLDTSAAMKLVRPEEHSNDLSAWLGERRQTPVLSSVLIELELVRATRRAAPERLERAAEVLRGIGIVTLSQSVLARACAYGDPTLRPLDAVHLATAEHVVALTDDPLDAFVAYDGRLLAAAQDLGLPIVAPGSSSLGA